MWKTASASLPSHKEPCTKDRTGGDLFLFTHLTVGCVRFYLFIYLISEPSRPPRPRTMRGFPCSLQQHSRGDSSFRPPPASRKCGYRRGLSKFSERAPTPTTERVVLATAEGQRVAAGGGRHRIGGEAILARANGAAAAQARDRLRLESLLRQGGGTAPSAASLKASATLVRPQRAALSELPSVSSPRVQSAAPPCSGGLVAEGGGARGGAGKGGRAGVALQRASSSPCPSLPWLP